MEISLVYSKAEMDAAVIFIATKNPSFLGMHNYIRGQILRSMREIAIDPERWMGDTMGYTLFADKEYEGMNSDSSSVRFEISVDPALGRDHNADTYIEEIINV